MAKKGMNLHKELAYPECHKEAAREAVGQYPGAGKQVVKNYEKGAGKGGVKQKK